MTTANMIDSIAQGLGALVWFDLHGTAIRPDALRGILAAEGDDPSIVPDIDAASAVRRAAREWRYADDVTRYRAEVVYDGADEVVIGLLAYEEPDAREAAWSQVERVAFDLQVGAWAVDPATVSEVAASFIGLADSRRTYHDHSFIRPKIILDRLKGWGAFSLRRQGGIYYVPRQHDEEVARLQRIVANIGSSALHVAHVSDTESSRQSIGGEARDSLASQVAEITEKIAAWTDRARNVRSDAVGRALAELQELRGHAELYADALELTIDDLTAEIDQAVEAATALVTGAPVKERAVSSKAADRLARITPDDVQPGDVWTVTFDDLREAGYPRSATKYKYYWTPSHRPELRAAGIVADSDVAAGVVTFTKIGEAESDQDEPAEPTDPSDASVSELFARYEAATGEAAPRLKRGFTKGDLARAVAEAETGKAVA